MKKAVTKKESENMGAEIFAAVDILESTKGIPRTYMLEKIEAALVSAYKKESGAVNVRIALDGEKKTFRIYQQKTVVEEVEDEKEQISLADARAISRRYNVGDVVEFELKTKSFGRLSAQAAKQVIIQGIREAEHSNIIREYEKKHECKRDVPLVFEVLEIDTGREYQRKKAGAVQRRDRQKIEDSQTGVEHAEQHKKLK